MSTMRGEVVTLDSTGGPCLYVMFFKDYVEIIDRLSPASIRLAPAEWANFRRLVEERCRDIQLGTLSLQMLRDGTAVLSKGDTRLVLGGEVWAEFERGIRKGEFGRSKVWSAKRKFVIAGFVSSSFGLLALLVGQSEVSYVFGNLGGVLFGSLVIEKFLRRP